MDGCYVVEGRIIFICPHCSTKGEYGYHWKSTEDVYVLLECGWCDWSNLLHMLNLLSENWVFHHYIIENTWNYVVASVPENEEAIVGKVVWV